MLRPDEDEDLQRLRSVKEKKDRHLSEADAETMCQFEKTYIFDSYDMLIL